jgi:hypothetical protein
VVIRTGAAGLRARLRLPDELRRGVDVHDSHNRRALDMGHARVRRSPHPFSNRPAATPNRRFGS